MQPGLSDPDLSQSIARTSVGSDYFRGPLFFLPGRLGPFFAPPSGFFSNRLWLFLDAFFLPGAASEDEPSVNLNKPASSCGFKSRHSPTGRPFELIFIILTRSSLVT